MGLLQGSIALIAVCQVFIFISYVVALQLNKQHLKVGQEMLSIHDLRLKEAKADFDLVHREKELRERADHLNHIEFLNKQEFERTHKNLQQRELLLIQKELKKTIVKPVSKKITAKK